MCGHITFVQEIGFYLLKNFNFSLTGTIRINDKDKIKIMIQVRFSMEKNI